MNRKQKLELTWIGKEQRPKLEPRILLEDPEKSYHAKHRVSDDDLFDNRVILGDNPIALKALEQKFMVEFGEDCQARIILRYPFLATSEGHDVTCQSTVP